MLEPGVQQVGVVHRTFTSSSKAKAIIAFLSFLPGTTLSWDPIQLQDVMVNAAAIKVMKERISKKLSPWMIPHHFEVLDALPLNVHGKIDYYALNELQLHSIDNFGASTRNAGILLPMETLIVNIWKNVLDLSNINYDGTRFLSTLVLISRRFLCLGRHFSSCNRNSGKMRARRDHGNAGDDISVWNPGSDFKSSYGV